MGLYLNTMTEVEEIKNRVKVVVGTNGMNYKTVDVVLEDGVYDKHKVETTIQSAIILKTLFGSKNNFKVNDSKVDKLSKKLGYNRTDLKGLLSGVMQDYLTIYDDLGDSLIKVELYYNNKVYTVEKVSDEIVKEILNKWDVRYPEIE